MTAYDGTDGTPLFTLSSNNLENQYGRAVCGLGDLDGDGVGEFAVGAPHEDGLATNGGRALLYRGAITDDCRIFWRGSMTAGSSASIDLLGAPNCDMFLAADTDPGPTSAGAYGMIQLGFSSNLTVLGDTLGLLGPPTGSNFDAQGITGFGPTVLAPFLSGVTVYLQGFALTPLAPNGQFQASPSLAVTIN